ncbi:MAG: nucleotidyl transferase AbiEii/AbiGii toxin family protein [Verrucomicrobiota bacterium]
MDDLEQLKAIFSHSEEAGLECLLIGGHAVILYAVPRFTRDIDLLVSEDQIREWRILLEEQHFECYYETPQFAQFRKQGSTDVDVMVVRQPVWDRLWHEAVEKEIVPGFAVGVPALLHLIAMKLHASKAAHRRPDAMDFSDVIRLFRIHGLQLEDEDVSAIVERYGGEEALASLRAALEQDD